MPNLIEVEYQQSGKSIGTNELGMREMQARAYVERTSQYLLIKSPPASGKSRALMFLALDKLKNQNIKKVIVTVPERIIGSSFSKTNLKDFGFFEDWEPNDIYNLCTPGADGSKSKVQAFKNFMNNDEKILICTHATFRFACDELDEKIFNDSLVAIDEFHHVSAKEDNRIGESIRSIINKSTAHIVAMTGSYFRGDTVPILLPEDEDKFTRIKYDYYEQLNGYKYLKSLGIGYHFYQGKYTSAIHEILDDNKKTIVHIPHPNTGESLKDKYNEVGFILDGIGDVIKQDDETGIIHLKRKSDGKMLKIADLVEDTPKLRDKTVNYLRNMDSVDDLDIIIALGMAMEGFDWPYCEHVLTVGYRGSLTQIIQIIGRCTRDSDNKTHAQFTNLIAQPDVADNEVTVAVNNMLKAITASLLMEQVLAPNFKFKPKFPGDVDEPGTIKIKGYKEPSEKVKNIIESDLSDLKAAILQDSTMLKAMPSSDFDPEVMNKVLIPKIIKRLKPELNDIEIESLRQHLVVDSVIKNGEIKETGDKRFVRMAGRFVNIDDLDIDMIDKINPFQKAFEILSKSVTTQVLKAIRDRIESIRIEMTVEEAIIRYPKIKEFIEMFGKKPDINSINENEKRLAQAIIVLNKEHRENKAKNS